MAQKSIACAPHNAPTPKNSGVCTSHPSPGWGRILGLSTIWVDHARCRRRLILASMANSRHVWNTPHNAPTSRNFGVPSSSMYLPWGQFLGWSMIWVNGHRRRPCTTKICMGTSPNSEEQVSNMPHNAPTSTTSGVQSFHLSPGWGRFLERSKTWGTHCRRRPSATKICMGASPLSVTHVSNMPHNAPPCTNSGVCSLHVSPGWGRFWK